MIDTEDQYADNINQIKALEAYLDSFKDGRTPDSAPSEMNKPIIRKLYLDSTRSMLEQFRCEAAEFEAANPRRDRSVIPEKVLQLTK